MSISRLSIPTLVSATLISTSAFAAGFIPSPGQTTVFERKYSAEQLRNQTLQIVTKTSFTLSNKGGKLTGKWKATMRDILTEESFEAEASGPCRTVGRRLVEFHCTFGTEESNTAFFKRKDGGVLINIPVGQGVQFTKKVDGETVPAPMLLGTDEESAFVLNRK